VACDVSTAKAQDAELNMFGPSWVKCMHEESAELTHARHLRVDIRGVHAV